MADSITQTLADFASQTRYEDLPEEVVDYTKLLIFDTVICGLAAGGLERTRMMHALLESLGGHEEATVFGTHKRYPASLAAMANAEIMNGLDADDTFFTTSHFAAFNVASALAEAQRCNATGRDLILAVALGFDINARMNLASLVIRENESGEFEWSPIQGMGFAAFGTSVSSAIIRKLDREQMRNCFGLAGTMAPTPTVNTTSNSRNHPSMKYANYPATALSGMLSALFAQGQYQARQTCLDNGGFFMAQGCLDFDTDLLLDGLGSQWWILETCFKYYPSCRYTHGPIDMLQRLMAEENISAGDIEKMVVYMNPMAYALRFFREPAPEIAIDHCAPFNGQFNIPYVLALTALQRKPGPEWYAPENLQDAKVWELARRITTEVDESARNEVHNAFKQKIRRFRKTPASISVRAKGRDFFRKTEYVMGDPWSAETKAGWDDIAAKFHNFCSELIPQSQRQTLIEQFKTLDALANINESLNLPV